MIARGRDAELLDAGEGARVGALFGLTVNDHAGQLESGIACNTMDGGSAHVPGAPDDDSI